MIRKDKLRVIYNTLKLLAPNKEYDLSDYDIFLGDWTGYVQIYSIKKSLYVENNMEIPTEILTLFKLDKLSDIEIGEVYDIIERNDVLLGIIGTPGGEINMYKATPIDKDLFKTI